MSHGGRLARGLLSHETPDLLDEDGRPVGEVASASYDPTTTEVVRCPYDDVRAGGLMNRSALRQMGRCWPALLSTFRALAGADPTVSDAFRASLVGTTAPLVAAILTDEPSFRVPTALSALYKTSLGLSQVTASWLMADDGVADAPLGELGSGEAFFRFLDEGRWLVGQEQVCAGTRGMLIEAWDALVGPGDGRLVEPLAALPARERWAPIVDTAVAAIATAGLALGGRQLGGEAWSGPRGPAWTRALFTVPGRRPEHALRLFPSGRFPPEIAAWFEDPAPTAPAWAARVQAAVRRAGERADW